MTIPEELKPILSTDSEIMHGQLCFKGTRVPLRVLLDNLADGMGVDEFVSEYPSVTRQQAITVVAWQQRETKEAFGLDLAS